MLALSKRNIFLPFISDIIEPLMRCMFFEYYGDTSYVKPAGEKLAPGQHIGAGYTQNPDTIEELTDLTKNIKADGQKKLEEKAAKKIGFPVAIPRFPLDMDGSRPFITFISKASEGLGPGYVALPMPTNMNFQDQANFGTVNASASEMGFTGGEGAFGAAIGALGGKIKDWAGKVNEIGAVQALARSQGLAKNPNIITEFSGMGTRRYTFQYKFMPRSAKESAAIRNIQYLFQARAYPTIKVENLVLKYPPKWNIIFSSDLPGLYECYLEGVGFTVNPSANTWHRDGAPGEVDLQLNFMETKALTAEDIIKLQNGSGNSGDVEWGNRLEE